MQSPNHQQQVSDDDDRRNRFLTPPNGEHGSHVLRERATSQPPRSSDHHSYLHSPSQQHYVPSGLSGGNGNNSAPWPTQRSPASATGPSFAGRQSLPQSALAVRSSSFSSNPQNQFSSALRDPRIFDSTFEDDESDFADAYDERYLPPQTMSRGRQYIQDPTKSRSQSLATTRPGPIGEGYNHGFSTRGLSPGGGWDSQSNPLNIPGVSARYADLKAQGGNSRFGSLGTVGRSPVNIHPSSPQSTAMLGNGYSTRNANDISNISPFVRDVGQILLDDGSAFRELWAGMNPPRDERDGGGGSGTTSRRHSVSVVSPRRAGGNVVGFNAPGHDGGDRDYQPLQAYSRSGMMLSDDDLASDLGMMSIGHNPHAIHERSASSSQIPSHVVSGGSQPASLPTTYVRGPSIPGRISPYQNLVIPSSFSRRATGSPSDGGSGGNISPARDREIGQFGAQTSAAGNGTLTARFVPGQGIQYVSQQSLQGGGSGAVYQRTRAPSYTGGTPIASPISPLGTRNIQQHSSSLLPQQITRRLSDAPQPGSSTLAELGKGVPLHAVPPSCPLYIVEFKAGRTDLFYTTDPNLHVHVGDLVIVEADRGKDLGKVVNDTISVGEVEAFQAQQAARMGAFGDDGPMSPGGNGASGKKDINPKMIYGKAQQQDTQLLLNKMQDEVKALQLCQSKVRAKKLPMEVIDAEYQWDRRKLTFYFIAEKRIDFRELVRELFRLYKTRIWMASLSGSNFEQ